MFLLALYFARRPFHRAVMSFSKIIYNAMRFTAASVLSAEKRLVKRNREVMMAAGLENAERVVERIHRVGHEARVPHEARIERRVDDGGSAAEVVRAPPARPDDTEKASVLLQRLQSWIRPELQLESPTAPRAPGG